MKKYLLVLFSLITNFGFMTAQHFGLRNITCDTEDSTTKISNKLLIENIQPPVLIFNNKTEDISEVFYKVYFKKFKNNIWKQQGLNFSCNFFLNKKGVLKREREIDYECFTGALANDFEKFYNIFYSKIKKWKPAKTLKDGKTLEYLLIIRIDIIKHNQIQFMLTGKYGEVLSKKVFENN